MDNNKLVDSGNNRLFVPEGAVAQTVLPRGQESNNDDEIDLLEIFAVLRRRLWLILLVAMLVFAAVFVYTASIQPVYRASTNIQIESEQSSQVLSFDIVQGEGENNEFYQTQYELLKSHRLATAVIRDLAIESHFSGEPGGAQPGKLQQGMLFVKHNLLGKDDTNYALGEYPMEARFLQGLTGFAG